MLNSTKIRILENRITHIEEHRHIERAEVSLLRHDIEKLVAQMGLEFRDIPPRRALLKKPETTSP